MKVQWRSSSEPHDLFGIGTPPNSTAPSCKACAAPMLRARRGAIGVDHISLCRKAKRPPCVQGGHGVSRLSRFGPLGARLCRGGVATGPRWALGCVAGLCPWPRGPQSTRRLTPRMTPDNRAAVKIACGKPEPKRQPIRRCDLQQFFEMCRSYYEELAAAGQLTEGVSGTVPA